MLLFENSHITPAVAYATGGSARSGDWVSLENYGRVGILVEIFQGAANTTAITVDVAVSTAGGSESTGITMANFWYCADVTVGTTADTWTKGTAAASITSSATGSGTSYYWIEIGADELNSMGTAGVDYNSVQVELALSSASNYVHAVYFLLEPRYAEDLTISPQ